MGDARIKPLTTCSICGEPLAYSRKLRIAYCLSMHIQARYVSRSDMQAIRAAQRKQNGTFRPSSGRPPIILDLGGEKKTIAQLAEEKRLPVAESTARHRHERGWTDAEVVGVGPLPKGAYLGK